MFKHELQSIKTSQVEYHLVKLSLSRCQVMYYFRYKVSAQGFIHLKISGSDVVFRPPEISPFISIKALEPFKNFWLWLLTGSAVVVVVVQVMIEPIRITWTHYVDPQIDIDNSIKMVDICIDSFVWIKLRNISVLSVLCHLPRQHEAEKMGSHQE